MCTMPVMFNCKRSGTRNMDKATSVMWLRSNNDAKLGSNKCPGNRLHRSLIFFAWYCGSVRANAWAKASWHKASNVTTTAVVDMMLTRGTTTCGAVVAGDATNAKQLAAGRHRSSPAAAGFRRGQEGGEVQAVSGAASPGTAGKYMRGVASGKVAEGDSAISRDFLRVNEEGAAVVLNCTTFEVAT